MFRPRLMPGGCLANLLFGFLTLGLSLLVPGLFMITVWLTGALLLLLQDVTGWRLNQGAVVLLAAGLWSGVASLLALFLPPLVELPLAPSLWLAVGVLGGIWGLCAGFWLVVREHLLLVRQPDAHPTSVHELPRGFYGYDDQRGQEEVTFEEMFGSGIILGERFEEDR